MSVLRLAACAAVMLGAAPGCYKVHPTSVAETSIEGEWRATIVRTPLPTIYFEMLIASDDERQLVVDILGRAAGVEQPSTGSGTFDGSSISVTVTSPKFFYLETGTFTGTRVSFSRLEGQIVYDVITNQGPMAVTFDKVPLKDRRTNPSG